ncbi:MAG: hypothetical protein J5518_00695 [Lachnospiraceae bacterium]|nr:hypothetical protein [Lachnospiraceae bacterium]
MYDQNIERKQLVTAPIKGKLYLLNNITDTYANAFPGRIYYKEAGKKGSKPKEYYVDANGVCQTGWQTINKQKFYFGADGKKLFDDFELNGKCYFINSDGSLYSDSQEKIIKSGSHVTGVVKKDGTYMAGWIYLDSSNSNVLKKPSKDGHTYYAGPGGSIMSVYNRIYLIGKKYYSVGSDGSMITGWKYMEQPEFVDASTGERIIRYYGKNFCFCFDPEAGNGMLTGLQKVDQKPCTANGQILTDQEGKAVINKGDATVFFYQDMTDDHPIGALALNMPVVDGGNLYSLRKDGTLCENESGWVDAEGSGYRLDDGTLARGRMAVKDNDVERYCCFDLQDGSLQKDCLRKTGNKWYYYNAKGMQEKKNIFASPAGEPKVKAVYAADGSISGFVYEADGKKASDVAILFSEEMTILGKDSLPATGLVAHAGVSRYYRADGRPYFTGGKNSLVKIGKKYYLCRDGKMLSGENELETLDVSLSEDEQKNLTAYFSVADSASVAPYYCYTGADGAVLQNALISGNPYGTHTNAYGLLIDDTDLAWFYKYGGKWHVPDKTGPGEDADSLYEYSTSFLVNVRIRWRADGVLQGIYGMDGKAVSGLYYYDVSGDSYAILLKNGLPVTGKQTVTLPGGIKSTMFFDADCGIRYDRLL